MKETEATMTGSTYKKYKEIATKCVVGNTLALSKSLSVFSADDIKGFLQETPHINTCYFSNNNYESRYLIDIMHTLKCHIPLVRLIISGSKIDSESSKAIAGVLRYNTNLKELHLTHNKFEDDGLEKIMKTLCSVSLMTLNLNRNKIFTRSVNNPTEILDMINVHEHSINSNSIGSNIIKPIADIIRYNTCLTTLFLLDITSEGEILAKRISEILKVCNTTTLTTLNLAGNNIKNEGAREIASILRYSYLIELYLSRNAIDHEGLETIARVLSINTILKSLYLTENNINDKGAKKIADMLRLNTSLTVLSLDKNYIGDEGIKEISKNLRLNTSLTILVLNENLIKARGAKEIADMFRDNVGLKELYLQSNTISDEGAKKISEGLRLNTSLTVLTLQDNAIGNEGAENISVNLILNGSLTTLQLHDNYITSKGAKSFRLLLRQNERIKTLGLNGNHISNSLLKDINALLLRKSIKVFLPLPNNRDDSLTDDEENKNANLEGSTESDNINENEIQSILESDTTTIFPFTPVNSTTSYADNPTAFWNNNLSVPSYTSYNTVPRFFPPINSTTTIGKHLRDESSEDEGENKKNRKPFE